MPMGKGEMACVPVWGGDSTGETGGGADLFFAGFDPSGGYAGARGDQANSVWPSAESWPGRPIWLRSANPSHQTQRL